MDAPLSEIRGLATLCFANVWSETLTINPLESIVTAGAFLIPASDLFIVRNMSYFTLILTSLTISVVIGHQISHFLSFEIE